MAHINTPDLRKMQDTMQRAYNFCVGFEGDEMQEGIANLLADIMTAQAILTTVSDGIADGALRAMADDKYGTDDIEIDDEPATSVAEDGTWVSAWVWIEAPEEEDDLKQASEGFTCDACGRPEHDCSEAPCEAVLADREA